AKLWLEEIASAIGWGGFSLGSKSVNRVIFESSMIASLIYSAPSSAGMEQLTVLGLTCSCLCACTVFLDLFLKSTCESEICRRSPNPAHLIRTRTSSQSALCSLRL